MGVYCDLQSFMMARLHFCLLVIAAVCASTIEAGNMAVKLTNIKVDMAPNDYFGDWSAEIHSPGNKISVKIPMKGDIPATMKVKSGFVINGDPVPESLMTLCDVFNDETIGKGLVQVGQPQGRFPQECPVLKSPEYKFEGYVVPEDKIPDSDDGTLSAKFELFIDADDILATITAEGELKQK